MAHVHGVGAHLHQLLGVGLEIFIDILIGYGDTVAFLGEEHVGGVVPLGGLHQALGADAGAQDGFDIICQTGKAQLPGQGIHLRLQAVQVFLVHGVGSVAILVAVEKIIHRQILRHIFSVEVVGFVGLEGLLLDVAGLLGRLEQQGFRLPGVQSLLQKIVLPGQVPLSQGAELLL